MDKALADLIKISNVTGKDKSLVAGGGGNTSVKTDDGKYMYVKASGTALKDMNERRGWRRLRMDAVLKVVGDKELGRLDSATRETEVVNRLLLACDDEVTNGARPSVESHLHALLDKCVIHLHPLVLAAYVSARGGKKELDKLFANEKYPPLWVPYTDPGFLLAKKVSSLIDGYKAQYGRKPSVMILQKHGLFVTAKTAKEALALVKKVVSRCSAALPKPEARIGFHPPELDIVAAKLSIRKAVFDAAGQYLPITWFGAEGAVAAFLERKDAPKLLNTPALNPDELVYANGSPLWFEKCYAPFVTRKLNALISRGQKPAAAFVVKDLGLFVAADKKAADVIADTAAGSLEVRMRASSFGGVLALTKREQDFINNWESEAFRKNVAGATSCGELKNRIAVITGAGSGLGRSIALGLARAGAIVAIADIDTKAAEETRAAITEELPNASAMVLGCNVTDEQSVRDGYDSLLVEYGGLDILVNAAGVAPAYPLVDLPVEKWRFALEVNLTGYFLMAKHAARIMIQQDMGGNIINISSKSGLDASKNNTPYNATKAGELHIARGWAMELGEYGIRVNSVCPGNVFEGSKIWNPEYIRVCAKKYGIKPEEVIPFYVSKTSLKREIKGQDVADSVVFLCSEKARTITGQILVPDSGQVMVR